MIVCTQYVLLVTNSTIVCTQYVLFSHQLHNHVNCWLREFLNHAVHVFRVWGINPSCPTYLHFSAYIPTPSISLPPTLFIYLPPPSPYLFFSSFSVPPLRLSPSTPPISVHRTQCLRIHWGGYQRRSWRRWDWGTMTVMYTRQPSHYHALQGR